MTRALSCLSFPHRATLKTHTIAAPPPLRAAVFICASCARHVQYEKLHTTPPHKLSHSLRSADNVVSSSSSSHSSSEALQSSPSSFAHLTASYVSTPAPTAAQLNYASNFFTRSTPKYLLSSAKFRQLPISDIPEVCFLGRSNVGKSSLLNALVHRTGVRLANVSSRPGRTRTMNAFGIGNVQIINRPAKSRAMQQRSKQQRQQQTSGVEALDQQQQQQQPREEQFERWTSVGAPGLVVLDMPGYGKASRTEWGTEAIKYLCSRKQLRRTFLLVDAEHGLKDSDLHMLSILRKEGVPHQIVLAKVDKLIVPSKRATVPAILRRIEEQLTPLFAATRQSIASAHAAANEGVPTLNDIITTSSEVALPPGSSGKIGIDNLRWAVLTAAGLDCDAMGKRRVVNLQLQRDQGEEAEKQQQRGSSRKIRNIDTSLAEDEEIVSWEEVEKARHGR